MERTERGTESQEELEDVQWRIWKLSARAYSVLAGELALGSQPIFMEAWRRLAAKPENFPKEQHKVLLEALDDPQQAASLSARVLEAARPFLLAVSRLHPTAISPAQLGFRASFSCSEPEVRRSVTVGAVRSEEVEAALVGVLRAYRACLEKSGPSGRMRAGVTELESVAKMMSPIEQASEVIWGFVVGTNGPIAIRGSDVLSCHLFRRIARAQWADVIWPMIEEQRRPTVMSAVAHRSVMQLMSGVKVHATGGRSVLVDQGGHTISELQCEPLTADRAALHAILLQTGSGELARIATPRFIVMYAACVQRREDWKAPVTFASWSDLAERLGVPAKETARVKALIGLLSCVHVRYPDGSSCSLFDGFRDKKGNPAAPGYVQLIPGPPWLGDRDPFMRAVADRSAAVRALVPIVGLPEAVGSPRDYAAEARLWLGGVLPALADQQRELAKGTGAHLPPMWWMQQAERWGISGASVRKVVDVWSGDSGPLQRVERDRYHLAKRYVAERALLEAGGRLREVRSARGRAASKRRMEDATIVFRRGR